MAMTKEDLKRWKDNEFTKFFFTHLKECEGRLKDIIVNIAPKENSNDEIKKYSGQLITITNILNMEWEDFNIEEGERDE